MLTTYPEIAEAYAKLANDLGDHLSSISGVHHCQFVIDLIESKEMDLISILDGGFADHKQLFCDLHTHMGSTCYELENILEIMDEALPEFEVITNLLEQYRKREKIEFVIEL